MTQNISQKQWDEAISDQIAFDKAQEVEAEKCLEILSQHKSTEYGSTTLHLRGMQTTWKSRTD